MHQPDARSDQKPIQDYTPPLAAPTFPPTEQVEYVPGYAVSPTIG